jgi:hypothetical protein
LPQRTFIEYALQELEESKYWKELLIEASIVPENRLVELMNEANELAAILVTCVKNAKDLKGAIAVGIGIAFDALWKAGEIEPLLLIPTYVLDFLCIHPFLDGNGRMARLLTLPLLYKAGYELGRYISLEQKIEQTKEGYYDSLYASSQGWHEMQHDILPWWEYFLGVMFGSYQEFERRVGLITTGRGTKTALVLDAIGHFRINFTIRDLQESCSHVGIDLIRRILREQKNDGKLECLGRGPNAKWRNR